MGKRKVPKLFSSEFRTHVIAGKPIITYERTLEEKEKIHSSPWACDPRDDEVYDPPWNKRVTQEGGWAMIIKDIPIQAGEGIKKNVRPGRIFYIEHDEGVDEFGFGSSGRYKVVSKTPWGTVWMWPYEYSVMEPDKLIALWQSGELIFRPTNMELGRFNDVVHYIRSRGVGVGDAMVMALGTLKGNIGWFEPTPELAKACEEMSHRFNHWVTPRTSKKTMNITLEISKGEAQLEQLK